MSTHVHYVIMIFRALYENSVTWNVGSLSMVVNPHSCWSLAQSQLPHLKPPPLHSPLLWPPSRQQNIYLHQDDINTPASFYVGQSNNMKLEAVLMQLSLCAVFSHRRKVPSCTWCKLARGEPAPSAISSKISYRLFTAVARSFSHRTLLQNLWSWWEFKLWHTHVVYTYLWRFI